MNKHRIHFWLWTALSAVAWVTTGVLIGLRWPQATATLCGPFYSAIAAGWVQAVGSILAIGVAIYVPYRMDANARHGRETDRKLRSRLMATKLLIPTLTLRHEAEKAAIRLKPMPEGADRNAPIYWNHGQPLRLGDIDSIKREWGDLAHLSGDLPEMFAVLIATTDGYNRRFDTLMSEMTISRSQLIWKRDGPTLAAIAENIAEMARHLFEAAQRESVLKLPASVVDAGTPKQ